MKNITKTFAVILTMLGCCSLNTAWAQDPTVHASGVTTVGTSTSYISLNWTNGNGSKRLVTCTPYGNPVAFPNDGAAYTASSTFGSGSNLGSSNYVVYNGTAAGTTIFGLSTGSHYTIRIFEYNTVSTYEYYLTSGGYPIYSEWTLATAPSSQASALNSSSISTNSVSLTWTAGSGTNELIALRAASTYTNVPVDGTDYVANTTFGSGSYITGTSPYPYVVYDATSTSTSPSGLSAGTTYTAAAFSYNGTSGANNYYTSSYPTETFTTLAAQPTASSSNISFSAITDNSMMVSWTMPSSGGGTYRIVTCKPGFVNADLPADATSYSASSVYGAGSQIGGASGAYVVYNGTGNYVNVTGLSLTSTYCFSVYEYNVASNVYNLTYNYLTTTYLSGYQSTLNVEPTTAPSSLSFSSITSNSVRASWANGNGARRIVGVASGRKQTGLAFDGVNDFVAVPNEYLFDYTSNMTVEAWIKVAAFTTADQAIITKGNDSWRLTRAGSTNALQFAFTWTFFGFDYVSAVTGTRNVNDGEWHHVAATYNGSQMVLYVDGTVDAYTFVGQDIDNSSAAVYIGANAGVAGKNFNGQIDEVRTWNYALSQNTIRSYMNKTLIGNEYGLNGYWKLDDGYAASATAKNASLLSSTVDGILTNFTAGAASSFSSSSGWVHSGAPVNCPLDFSFYSDNPSFMGSTGSAFTFGNLYFTVYRGPDSTTINVTNLSPASYYTFKVFDYNGVTGYNNYLTDNYAIGEVLTASVSAPVITSFSPASGTTGAIVTINGTGFNPTAANNTVYFGATRAVVLSANAGGTILTVQVPSGATFERISVTNNTLTAYSAKPFIVLSSCGGSTITASSLSAPASLGSLSYYPSDQTLADIDLDGKPDLVSVYTSYYTSVTRNQSTSAGISFGSPYNYYNPYSLYSDVVTADFDGDGKLDIAVNNRYASVSSIIASRNTSSIAAVSFSAMAEFAANSANAIKDIAAADLDKDGKPDIIVCYGSTTYSYFRNNSSLGTISFEPRVDGTVSGSPLLNSIATGDLDADGKIDVAFAGGTGNNVTFIRNTSTVGSISFAASTATATTGATEGIAIGDIDTDGKMDVVCGSGTSSIAVLKNNSSVGSISFLAPTYVASLANTVTDVDLGDVDGDGKVDIGVGYSTGTQVTLFKNNTVGAISIGAAVNFTTASSYTNPAQISMGDLNADSKADFLASSSTTAYSVYQNAINPLAAEPVVPASNLVFSSITTSQIHLDFDPGSGANKVVFVRVAGTVGLTPMDGVNYVPNTLYGSGDDLGGGNYCVFNGNGNSVTVTGLQSNTLYTFSVYEYNGATPCEYNFISNTTGNSASIATNNTPPTLTAIADPTSVCQGAGLQTINLTGIGTGAGSEVQTISISASSSNTGLIPTPSISYTSPAATGTLTYTPVAGVAGSAVITITVNDGASNNNLLVETFTVTVDNTPTVSVAGPNQEICSGVGTLAGNIPAFGTGLWTISATTNGAITITDPTNPTSTVNNFLLNDSATFVWTISNGACPPSVSSARVKRKNCPTTADFTVNSTSECLSGSPVVTYTDASVASGGSVVAWSWNFGAGAFPPSATGVGPHTVTYSTAGAKTVSLQVTDNLAATDIEIKTGFVNINDVPEPSGNISGSTTVCQGQNGVTYSVPVIAGATGYTWNLPSGASIISGVNTNNVTIDFGASALSGNMTVRGTNSCGNGALSANFPVTVNPLPAASAAISGPSSVCDGATGVSYSIASITNATGYVWSLPAGAIMMSGAGTTSITVNYAAGSAGGTLSVYGTNACGNGNAASMNITVDPYPDAADMITGLTSITDCPSTSGVTYSIPLVNNASSYTWTVPSGASITAGAGSNVITVDFGSSAVSGDITVTPMNSCGAGSSSILAVTVNTLPEDAGILSGNDSLTICPASAGITYSIPAVFNADYYVWSVPSGATIVGGDSTNTISLDFSSGAVSGNITVYAANACGNGASSTLYVNIPAVQTQELCLVTVDNTSTFNKVIWEKPITMDIDSFRIYREITSSFVHIASVAYDSLSEYNDSVFLPAADPNTTNFRYKISVIDTCGNESELSTHHRTIFLQANQGVGNVVNLNWVPYEGATVSFYRILRDTTGTGVYVAIDSVPGSNTVYTDNSPPSTVAYIDYQLESIWPTTCTSTRATVNTTRSNIKHTAFAAGSVGVAEQSILSNNINVYPNPASSELTLEFPAGFRSYQLTMFNSLGQQVYAEQLNDENAYSGMAQHKIDVSGFSKGIYILSLQTEYGNTFRRLIIQ